MAIKEYVATSFIKIYLLLLGVCTLLLASACFALEDNSGFFEPFEEEPPLEEPTEPPQAATPTLGNIEPEPTNTSAPIISGDSLNLEIDSSGLVAAQTEPSFQTGDCPFSRLLAAKYSIECGTLFVPENRESDSGKMIQLAVAILPAANGSPLPDPVVYLEGGPGGSAIAGFEADPDGWAQYGFTQNRDLILFDQRGTGYSIPELDCDDSDETMGAEELAEMCKADLEAAGIDLSAYNTQENGADVADLVTALGYDSINLLGISYGTRLGLAIMRDHPEKLRSVVLDSPFPPNANPAETEAGLAWGRFEAIFEACAADSACNTTFPDLEQTFLDTVDILNEEPIDDIYGDDLIAIVQQMLFSGENYVFLIPVLIDQVYQGNLELFFELEPELFGMHQPNIMFSSFRQSISDDGETDGDAVGMYNSVMCHDEFAFATIDRADSVATQEVPDQTYYGLFGSVIDTFTTCSIWDVGSAEPFADAAVVSDIPTLVLVGEFDPVTPPEWGQLTVETLSNGTLVEIPGDGHSLVSSNGCAISLMDAFIANPNTIDLSCAEEVEPIYFDLGN